MGTMVLWVPILWELPVLWVLPTGLFVFRSSAHMDQVHIYALFCSFVWRTAFLTFSTKMDPSLIIVSSGARVSFPFCVFIYFITHLDLSRSALFLFLLSPFPPLRQRTQKKPTPVFSLLFRFFFRQRTQKKPTPVFSLFFRFFFQQRTQKKPTPVFSLFFFVFSFNNAPGTSPHPSFSSLFVSSFKNAPGTSPGPCTADDGLYCAHSRALQDRIQLLALCAPSTPPCT